MKRPYCALAMVKNEGIFMPFWLKHYTKYFDPQDLIVHSDGSTDNTEELCRAAGVTFEAIPPGTVAVGRNNLYIKPLITRLLEQYECVLFAESPDDILVPGPVHNYDLRVYLDDFLKSKDQFRFLTAINVTHHASEPDYDPAKGTLLSQRKHGIRCNQYDNAFLWKTTPLWGRGWHDFGGPRMCGFGDSQGEDKRLYNLHIHYADFNLCNARHLVRRATYNTNQQQAYACAVGLDLRAYMDQMLTTPEKVFSEGSLTPIQDWMAQVI